MALLSVHDLHVTYGRGKRAVPAVRGVSFDLAAGESLGIAGESGCGKSTVASALLRLLPDDTKVTGAVSFDGENVLTMKPGRLRAVRWSDMSIVFQGALHVMNPVRTVGHQVEEPLRLHDPNLTAKQRQSRLVELFTQVGLSESRLSAYPHQLSGGQRQRVMIAMALACRPRLLIADEPTTALDVIVQAQILTLLADLQRDVGMAMIFITHDLSVLGATCHRLAVMYAGRIVESNHAVNVLTSPDHPYTRALLGAFPRVGAENDRFAPRGLGGDPPDPRAMPSGCSFQPRCPKAIPRCGLAEPELIGTPGGRFVACIHADDDRQLTTETERPDQ